MSLKIYETVLKKIIRNLENHFRKVHTKRHPGSDIKCPGCNEWYAVSGIKFKHPPIQDGPIGTDYFITTCGQCGTQSNWDPTIAPVLIRVDNKGNPV
ncbi:MAG: hypothetical protein DRQ62_10570 [Gammaproteobacteria bacterium]|nr:MAG: hypothetical protein DRQ62_10570 [Gammaproteobacteria bacterium]